MLAPGKLVNNKTLQTAPLTLAAPEAAHDYRICLFVYVFFKKLTSFRSHRPLEIPYSFPQMAEMSLLGGGLNGWTQHFSLLEKMEC